jgi:hypothetical protein
MLCGMPAAPTPPEILGRIRAELGVTSWEVVARELGVGVRILYDWKEGKVEPGWENAILLLDRGGYLMDPDRAVSEVELRQTIEEARETVLHAQRLVERLERQDDQ